MLFFFASCQVAGVPAEDFTVGQRIEMLPALAVGFPAGEIESIPPVSLQQVFSTPVVVAVGNICALAVTLTPFPRRLYHFFRKFRHPTPPPISCPIFFITF